MAKIKGLGGILVFLLAWAAPSAPLIDEDSQRIMDLRFSDGTGAASSFVIFPFEGQWILPLQQLSDAMGFQINISNNLGAAEGFVLKENRTFKLDLGACRVIYEGKNDSFDCRKVISYDGDIYIHIDLINKWFPLTAKVDPLGSTVWVQTKEPFPAQESVLRSRQSVPSKFGLARKDPGFPRVETPYAWVDGYVLDQQLGYTSAHSSTLGRSESFVHDSVFAGEFLKMETHAFLSGEKDKIQQARLNLARKNADGGLLGSLNATDVQGVNVDLDPLNLVSEGGLGLGGKVSNFPLTAPLQQGTQNFVGDLPEGWEVELYQNEILIDRQTDSSKKRYEFKDVPLNYGLNRFRLTFYGPQGQKYDRYETYNIDSSLNEEGKTLYRVGFVRLDNQQDRSTLELRHSVSKYVSVQTAYARLTPKRLADNIHYGLLGVSTYMDSLLVTASGVAASDHGQAYDLGLMFPIRTISFSANHTILDQFRSDYFNNSSPLQQDYQTKLGVNFLVPLGYNFRFWVEAVRKHYLGDIVKNTAINRISVSIGSLFFNNELILEESELPVTGFFTAIWLKGLTQTKTVLGYDNKRLQSVASDVQLRVAPMSTLKLAADRRLTERSTNFSLGLIRTFKHFTVSSTVASNFDSQFSINGLLSYSLFGNDGGWNMSPLAQSNAGIVRVFVFHDKNQNKVFDAGDEPVKNVGVLVNQQSTEGVTSDNGILEIANMPAHQNTDVTLAVRTIENPDLRPASPGYRIYPRPGKIVNLDYPLITLKDLYGQIYVPTKKGLSPKQLKVELVDSKGEVIQSVRPESDGYFVFESVKPGRYGARISSETSSRLGAKVQPASFDVDLENGEFDKSIEFNIE